MSKPPVMKVEIRKPPDELFAPATTFAELGQRHAALRRAIVCQSISRHDASNLVRLEFAELARIALAYKMVRMGGGIDPKLLP